MVFLKFLPGFFTDISTSTSQNETLHLSPNDTCLPAPGIYSDDGWSPVHSCTNSSASLAASFSLPQRVYLVTDCCYLFPNASQMCSLLCIPTVLYFSLQITAVLNPGPAYINAFSTLDFTYLFIHLSLLSVIEVEAWTFFMF